MVPLPYDVPPAWPSALIDDPDWQAAIEMGIDVTLLEDGWHRKVGDGSSGPAALADKDLQRLIEWLLG